MISISDKIQLNNTGSTKSTLSLFLSHTYLSLVLSYTSYLRLYICISIREGSLKPDKPSDRWGRIYRAEIKSGKVRKHAWLVLSCGKVREEEYKSTGESEGNIAEEIYVCRTKLHRSAKQPGQCSAQSVVMYNDFIGMPIIGQNCSGSWRAYTRGFVSQASFGSGRTRSSVSLRYSEVETERFDFISSIEIRNPTQCRRRLITLELWLDYKLPINYFRPIILPLLRDANIS